MLNIETVAAKLITFICAMRCTLLSPTPKSWSSTWSGECIVLGGWYASVNKQKKIPALLGHVFQQGSKDDMNRFQKAL